MEFRAQFFAKSFAQFFVCGIMLHVVGDEPGILFSLDFVDGKLDENGTRLPAATAIIENLTSLTSILRAA